jgi:hypothetical protein
VRWTYVSSPLLYSHPPGKGHVPQDEEHEGCRDEFVRGLGRRLPVNYDCSIVVVIWCNYLTILCRTPLYSKDVTFISVPWVIICVRLDPSTHLIRTRVWPLNPGVTTHHQLYKTCDNARLGEAFKLKNLWWIIEREMGPWAISKCFGDLVSNTSA